VTPGSENRVYYCVLRTIRIPNLIFPQLVSISRSEQLNWTAKQLNCRLFKALIVVAICLSIDCLLISFLYSKSVLYFIFISNIYIKSSNCPLFQIDFYLLFLYFFICSNLWLGFEVFSFKLISKFKVFALK